MTVIAATTLALAPAAAQHHMPDGAPMGFDQHAAAHHFKLAADGGSIEVTARKPDAPLVAQIRDHLKMIAGEFARGEFEKPLAVHGEMPPGVDVLRQRLSAVTYKYEDVREGGAIRIRTGDPAALAALHDFLRYQIREHKTGDSTTVKRAATAARTPR